MANITVAPYNSKTGEGTLSYYARQYGTTVDALTKANNISDPNTIRVGASLVVPDSGIQQTTTSYRQQTNDRMNQFNRDEQRRLQEEQAAQEQERISQSRTDGTDGAGNTSTTTGENTTGGATGTTTEDDGFADLLTGLSETEATLRSENLKSVKEIEARYDRIQKQVDRAHRDLISATRQIYRGRIEAMRDKNKRLVATKDAVNIRSGRSRYTAELAQGIITDEELAGEERIATIEGEMLKAIADANSAKAKGDMERFNAAFDRVEKMKADMESQIKQNFENAMSVDKARRERRKEEREAQKDAFDQGMKRAKAAAPALVDKMAEFADDATRTAFLEAYAERTGVDLDILVGEIETASLAKEKSELDIENIRNTIANRNANTAIARQREARLAQEKADEEEELNVATKNIMDGASSLEDITNADKKQEVIGELRELGYYSPLPPEWYIDFLNEKLGQTVNPERLQQEWDKERRRAGTVV